MGLAGCDYAWERPDPVALRAAGYEFACRYLSYDTTGKNLTRSEAQRLHAAGLSIVLNWEYDPQAALRGFIQGHDDAVEAAAQREAVGAPPSIPVYFSVDFGATAEQMQEVLSYLAGCVSVLGYDGVGVYGRLSVIIAADTARACRWLWQTYGWSGGLWSTAAHIRQTANGVPFQGLSIDQDLAMTVDYGQWKAGTTVVQMLVRANDDPQVWLCDGMFRRKVADADIIHELNGQVHQDALLGPLGNGGQVFTTGPAAGMDVWGVDVATLGAAAAATHSGTLSGTGTLSGSFTVSG